MVSKTLPLAEQALALGQHYLRQGRDLEALDILGKLARLGHIDPAISEQAQVHLAEIHLRRRDFKQARRHLNVALASQPDNAAYHHLMAMAVEDDPDADPRRAVLHYRKAVELEPENAEYRSDYGLFIIDFGKPREGIRQLEKAVKLAPEDGQFAQQLTLALAGEGQFDKARRVALHALFRNPDDSRLRRLWYDLRFQEARFDQQRCKLKAKNAEVVLLPFEPKPPKQPATIKMEDGTILRLDPPAPPKPPTPQRQKRRQSR